jgi:hypothetical protein
MPHYLGQTDAAQLVFRSTGGLSGHGVHQVYRHLEVKHPLAHGRLHQLPLGFM